ncbi:unnamed protein product (mitochondrion) [Plasmodiophora brassicae]|uniref:Very-long-chain 3-oxoacyl-CoA reductase n=1 Tax=Plasmodiophora brassicae TaxID=37360 RepID=A0A0G4IUN1_PLABS|nr:hypothetical protein PBRA_006953 [Plasmodiophora brassicae]SPR00542.1 unnamed protein product [Plasmodiophora brassicae]
MWLPSSLSSSSLPNMMVWPSGACATGAALGYAASAMAVVGVACTVYALHAVLRFAWVYLLRPASSFKAYNPTGASWAIVTGASEGIGRAFALSLAKRGMHVVLVSRSRDKLDAVANDITGLYPKTRTLTIPCDASAPNAVQTVVAALPSDMDLTVLVNNVGVSEALPSELSTMDPAVIQRIIQVNVTFTTLLTAALIPRLQHADGRTRAAIINMSSLSAVVPVPLHSVYAGSKAYIDTWSRCLSGELRPYRFDVLSCTTAYVQTSMSGFRRTSLMVIAPGQAAEDALGKVSCGIASLAPSAVHAVLQRVSLMLPEKRLAGILRDKMLTARRKLLGREAKAQGKKVD